MALTRVASRPVREQPLLNLSTNPMQGCDLLAFSLCASQARTEIVRRKTFGFASATTVLARFINQ
jgi:hypothetical protein